jgi:hypothetical protein
MRIPGRTPVDAGNGNHALEAAFRQIDLELAETRIARLEKRVQLTELLVLGLITGFILVYATKGKVKLP